MTAPRQTCHGCTNLATMPVAMGGHVAYCKPRDAVVPQSFKGDPPQITYWRVPLECPLPDSEVHKSAEKAPVSKWVTVPMTAVR